MSCNWLQEYLQFAGWGIQFVSKYWNAQDTNIKHSQNLTQPLALWISLLAECETSNHLHWRIPSQNTVDPKHTHTTISSAIFQVIIHYQWPNRKPLEIAAVVYYMLQSLPATQPTVSRALKAYKEIRQSTTMSDLRWQYNRRETFKNWLKNWHTCMYNQRVTTSTNWPLSESRNAVQPETAACCSALAHVSPSEHSLHHHPGLPPPFSELWWHTARQCPCVQQATPARSTTNVTDFQQFIS